MFVEAGRIVGGSEAFQQTYANRDLTLERKLEFFFRELSRAGDVWVVMDNFEDLLAPDDTIADPELRQFIETAVDTSHTVRLIATTRAIPRFRGSQQVKPIDLREGLPEDQAIAYLRTDGADYGLADADEGLLRAFVNRVHRIPKALESVIGYLSEKYPVVQLSDLMANDALFADFDRHDAENGLKRLIAEQFADQTPDAQLVLCALSIFPKPAPLTALRYLLPALDWASVLPRLERNRLVGRQVDRYDLHPIVREYAYAQIPEYMQDSRFRSERSGDSPMGSGQADLSEIQDSGETVSAPSTNGVPFTRSALHTRAADFFRELRKPQQEWKTIADLEPQLDEFHHRVRAGQYDAAARVLNDIDFDYLQLWGHARTVIELRQQLEGKLTDTDLARVNVGHLGFVYQDTGRVREAIPCLERALQSARDEDNQGGIGVWLGNLGNAYADLGETRQAIEYYEQVLEIARAIGDRRGEGNCLGNLGIAYADLGERHQAIRYYKQALAIKREIGDRVGEGKQLDNLGAAYLRSGEFDSAIGHYTQAARVSEEVGDKENQSYALGGLGAVHHHRVNLADARRCYADALALDMPRTDYSCAVKLGVLCLEEGKAEDAQDYFARGIALCRALLEKTPRLYDALYELALAQLGGGQPDGALVTYRQALEVCAAKGVVQNALQDLRLLGRAVLPVAGLAEAVALLEKATEGGVK